MPSLGSTQSGQRFASSGQVLVASVSSVHARRSCPASEKRTHIGTCHCRAASPFEPTGSARRCARERLGALPFGHSRVSETRGAPVWSRKVENGGATSRPASCETASRNWADVALPHACAAR